MAWNVGNNDPIDIIVEVVGAREAAAAMNETAAAETRVGDAARATGLKMEESSKRTWLASQAMFTLRRAAYQATLGLTAVVAGAVYVGLKFDSTMQGNTIALTKFLGSTTAARAELASLYHLAAYTPFQFHDVTTAAMSFLSFGFTVKQTNSYLKTMADTASGLNLSGAQIQSFTNDLVKMSARGKITAQDIRELVALRIPATSILAQGLGLPALTSGASIGAMNIKSQAAIDALMAGLNAKYGGMAAKLQKTAQGQISTLKDLGSMLLGNVMMPLYLWIQNKLLPGINEILGKLFIAFGPHGGGLAQALLLITNDPKIAGWFKLLFSDIVALINFMNGPGINTIAHFAAVWGVVAYGILKVIGPLLNLMTYLDNLSHGQFSTFIGVTLGLITVLRTLSWLVKTDLIQSMFGLGRLMVAGIVQLWQWVAASLAKNVAMAEEEILTGEVMAETEALTVMYEAQFVAMDELTIGATLLAGAYEAQAIAAGTATEAQVALDAAMWANPIGLIILAVLALAVGFGLLYWKVKWFRDFVNQNWPVLASVLIGPFAIVVGFIKDNFGEIVQLIDWVIQKAKEAANLVSDLNPINYLFGTPTTFSGGTGGGGGRAAHYTPSRVVTATPMADAKPYVPGNDGAGFTSHTTLVVDRKVIGEASARYQLDQQARR